MDQFGCRVQLPLRDNTKNPFLLLLEQAGFDCRHRNACLKLVQKRIPYLFKPFGHNEELNLGFAEHHNLIQHHAFKKQNEDAEQRLLRRYKQRLTADYEEITEPNKDGHRFVRPFGENQRNNIHSARA